MLLIRKQNETTDAPFRRCVRDAKGAVVKTFVFPSGEPVDVELEDLHHLRGDIGRILVPCDFDSKGKLRQHSLDDPKIAKALARALDASATLNAPQACEATDAPTREPNAVPVAPPPAPAVEQPATEPSPGSPTAAPVVDPPSDPEQPETDSAPSADVEPDPADEPAGDDVPAEPSPEDNSQPEADKPRKGKRGK